MEETAGNWQDEVHEGRAKGRKEGRIKIRKEEKMEEREK